MPVIACVEPYGMQWLYCRRQNGLVLSVFLIPENQELLGFCPFSMRQKVASKRVKGGC